MDCLELSITEMASKVLAKNHWTWNTRVSRIFFLKEGRRLGSECETQLQEKSQFASLRV